MSGILRSRIDLLLKNMAMGLLLVGGLLGLFLNLRLAFWVMLGIPVSFMAALMGLPRFGISINMISLFAFIMVLGIVVDDAIVIGENIFRKQEQGLSPMKAAVEEHPGSRPSGCIFRPDHDGGFLAAASRRGTMGKIMWNLPIVVILVLLGSLVESLFILPAHLARKNIQYSPGHRKTETGWPDGWNGSYMARMPP